MRKTRHLNDGVCDTITYKCSFVFFHEQDRQFGATPIATASEEFVKNTLNYDFRASCDGFFRWCD